MKVVTYGRISQAGDDDTSLSNQRAIVEQYAEDNDLECVGWFEDRNVSGKTHPSDRDGFQELMGVLRETDEINTVLVKDGRRLARGRSASEITNFLQGELGREIEFVYTNPTGLEEQVDMMMGADEGTAEWVMGPMMDGANKMVERQQIAEAIEKGSLSDPWYGTGY